MTYEENMRTIMSRWMIMPIFYMAAINKFWEIMTEEPDQTQKDLEKIKELLDDIENNKFYKKEEWIF